LTQEAGPSAFARVLNVSELPPGTKKAVDVHGVSVLVCNTNDRLYAVSNICSHAREKLECGRMSRGWIGCPVHGARFDLATGRAMNPPAKEPIATFPVRLVDDWIEVAAASASTPRG
jgi:3-phenylpropionate/trans-cinnamate dioxygenase ferredoxin component